MSTIEKIAAPVRPPNPTRPHLPPLENGDRLSRAEFERRYDATPNLKKAELIEGVVYMPPPAVSFSYHGGPHFELIGWLALYSAATPGVKGGDNSSLRLDMDNMPQPDAFLVVLPTHGGKAKVSEDGYLEGAPELIAEISGSTVSYDMNVKMDVYRRNAVREYVVWRVWDEAIDWFVLREGRYQPLALVDGAYRSEAMPGLWLDPAALLRGDPVVVNRVLQSGLATPEHRLAFVSRLQHAAAGKT